jgi:hypothetical protein
MRARFPPHIFTKCGRIFMLFSSLSSFPPMANRRPIFRSAFSWWLLLRTFVAAFFDVKPASRRQ